MTRTQIELTDEQAERLRLRCAEERISLAEAIHRGVELYLAQGGPTDRDELKRRALAAAGRFSSGLKDVSEKHDEYLN